MDFFGIINNNAYICILIKNIKIMSENKRVLRNFLSTVYNQSNFQLWKMNVNGNNATYYMKGGGFIGKGLITISKDKEEAINLMKFINPDTDWSNFEIEKYKDYTIVLD